MKCLSCDKVLSNKEATRKSALTGEFIDLCDDCFSTIAENVEVIEGRDIQDDNDEELAG